MIHETKRSFGAAKSLAKAVLAAPLMPHAHEIPRRIQNRPGINGLLAGRVATQVVQESGARWRPTLANIIDIARADARELQACPNCQSGVACIVLQSA